MFRSISATMACMLCVFYSCKSAQEGRSNLQGQEKTKTKVLLVTHGGFNSCKILKKDEAVEFDIFTSALFRISTKACPNNEKCQKETPWLTVSLLDRLEERFPNAEFSWITSCYSSAAKAYYTSSEDSEKQVPKKSPEELFQAVENLAEKVDRVAIIGHSYGGWSAIKSAQIKTVKKLLAFSTIDPISMKHCYQSAYLQSKEGCRQFPRDISKDEIQTIKDKSPFWRNYFQKVTVATYYSLPLHSGPTKLEWVTDKEINKSHTSIDNDKSVWDQHFNDISQSLENYLNP